MVIVHCAIMISHKKNIQICKMLFGEEIDRKELSDCYWDVKEQVAPIGRPKYVAASYKLEVESWSVWCKNWGEGEN